MVGCVSDHVPIFLGAHQKRDLLVGCCGPNLPLNKVPRMQLDDAYHNDKERKGINLIVT